jgi:hypothetical protein
MTGHPREEISLGRFEHEIRQESRIGPFQQSGCVGGVLINSIAVRIAGLEADEHTGTVLAGSDDLCAPVGGRASNNLMLE